MIDHHSKLAGFYKLEKHSLDGSGKEIPGSRVETDWFPNLITDTGLNMLGGGGSILGRCFIGTGNTAPVETNTALQAQVAYRDGTVTAGPTGSNYVSAIGTYVFPQGAVVGNMQEIGVGNTSNALFSRALIVDGNGAPTVLTLTAIDVLTVTYQLREYPSQADVVGTIADGANTYTVTTRTADGLQSNRLSNWVNFGFSSGGRYCYVSNGVLGPWTGRPTGTPSSEAFQTSSITWGTYSNGNMWREVTCSFPVDKGNVGGSGITVAYINAPGSPPGPPSLQASFDPPIAKNNTRTLSLTWRLSWGRL